VETVGALDDNFGDRRLAVGRRRQRKKRTQGDGGSRKKLAIGSRRMTHSAIPASRKEHGRQGLGRRDNVARGVHEERTLGKRRWAQREWKNGI
jgi:hypothetical protein